MSSWIGEILSPACYCDESCPCGCLGGVQKVRTCASAVVTEYHEKISGPIFDCIDIHIEVPSVGYEKLSVIDWEKPASRFSNGFKLQERDIQYPNLPVTNLPTPTSFVTPTCASAR